MCFNNARHWIALLLLSGQLGACGGGGGGSEPAAALAPNALRVFVDTGPPDTGYNVNRLYTSVTICQPGSSVLCQTISHVLVDTGSTGLRLLSSQLSPTLNLTRSTGASGLPLLNCVQFLDNSFGWGPVALADIVLGEKRASGVPVQVMADPAFNDRAGACASGTALTTAALLGANGIVGMGMFKEDCGISCVSVAGNGFYYTCTDVSCSGTVGVAVSLAQQLKNPVPLFSADNNGVLIELPAVSLAGAAGVSGTLIFGIGTQANNQPGTPTVLTARANGMINATLEGRSLSLGFIDTGSNGLFFDLATLPDCGGRAAGFYCPASRTTVAVTLEGTNAATAPVTLVVDNALALFATYPNAAFATLAGTVGDARILDLGLPFYYGRRVFMGIEGVSSALGVGPLYAF